MPGFDIVTMNYYIVISTPDSMYLLIVFTWSGRQNFKLVNQDVYNGWQMNE